MKPPSPLQAANGGAVAENGRYGLFTVDVEDWYHPLIKDPGRWDGFEDRIVAPTIRLLEILEAHGSHGTFFVLGVVAERHPVLVRRILEGGHEVGCHGHFHYSLQWLDPDGFRAEIARSMAALRAAGAHDVVSYRAPYFSLDAATEWALPILAEHGLTIDSSVFPLRTGYYGQGAARNHPHARGEVFEFPVTLPTYAGLRVPLTGGFYSRFFPVAWTVASIQRVLDQGGEPMFYIHPWELDPDHPRIRVGRFLTYRHYLRLERTAALLDELVRRWRWRSLRASHAAREIA
jgi:polysaccharide deacetylase family protein (PEP-CTERM system associated)